MSASEEAMRRLVGVAAPNYLGAAQPGGGWQGTIGGTRMVLGGLPANATQAEAENYYRNSTAYQRSTGGGYLSGDAYAALNPNASANDLAKYDQYYRTQEDLRNRNIQQGFGSNPLTTIAAFIAAAAGGAAASGWGAGAGAAGEAGAGAGAGGAGLGSTVGSTVGGSFGGGTIAANGVAAGSGAGLAGSGLGAGAAGGAAALGGGSAAGGSSGLGIFANGGAGGMAGVGGGNAGALASSGGISGGAGVGGTTGGALGGASGVTNYLSGAGGTSGGNMGWGDWVNLGGSLLGSYLQGRGASNAADASAAGIKAGIAEQARQFDLSRQDQMPWLQAGTAALGRLQDPNAFQQSPGYQFTRNEAFRDIGNQFSARGGAQSGNALRALQDRAANLASQDYGNWFNQQASLAGLGQTSAQSLGSLGQNNANNVSNLLGQQGNARASGIEGQTNAMTGGLADFLSWYNRRRGN